MVASENGVGGMGWDKKTRRKKRKCYPPEDVLEGSAVLVHAE